MVVEMLLMFFYIPFFAGLVYNVTPYMEYHPGGEDELMKAAGTDGTDLFDQVRTTGSEWHLLTKRYIEKMHVF